MQYAPNLVSVGFLKYSFQIISQPGVKWIAQAFTSNSPSHLHKVVVAPQHVVREGHLGLGGVHSRLTVGGHALQLLLAERLQLRHGRLQL